MSDLQRIKELLNLLTQDASSEAVFELVDLYLSAGMNDAALDAVKQWCAANPGIDRGLAVWARVCLINNQFDETRSILQRIGSDSSADEAARLVAIELDIRQGNFSLARKKLSSFRELYGQCSQWTELEQQVSEWSVDMNEKELPTVVTPTMADLYFRQGLAEKALPLYQYLLKQNPENALYVNRIKQILGEQQARQLGAESSQFQDGQRQVLTRWLSAIQRRRTHV
jgi:tetratricopeptide (TPR) repeat protein